MTKISRTGSTMKQTAYARRIFGAQGVSKKAIALDVGYGICAANSVKSKIENKKGFNNAMLKLAVESNNLALAAMAEFKSRGFEDFSNKDLISALTAVSGAWEKFNTIREKNPEDQSKNKLRTVILQNIENQTLTAHKPDVVIETATPVSNTETVDAEYEEVKNDGESEENNKEEIPDLDF